MTSAGAFRAGSQGFGQQFAQHVGAGPFLSVSERVDLGERVGVESNRNLGAGGSSGHASSVSHLTTCHATGYSLGMTTTAPQVGKRIHANTTTPSQYFVPKAAHS